MITKEPVAREFESNPWMLMVRAFQIRFGQGYDGPPRELPASVASLRTKLIREEADELVDAINRGELHEQLDALVDLLYVTIGTANAMGFADVLDEAFARVHFANMQKQLVQSRHESKRDSAWDIVKGPDWKPSRLDDLVVPK
jgi:predicted HAD superfamily Cof-like phosphohydrolase